MTMAGRDSFSRHMTARADAHMSVPVAIVLGVFAVGLMVWLPSDAAVAVIVGSVILLSVVDGVERRRVRRLKDARAGESICTFARAFPRREVDPWILRATYEEIQASAPGVPVRPLDTFKRDLRIISDDLDDLAREVARRSGRVWDRESTRRNPYRGGKVETVADLVRFMEHQPRKTTS